MCYPLQITMCLSVMYMYIAFLDIVECLHVAMYMKILNLITISYKNCVAYLYSSVETTLCLFLKSSFCQMMKELVGKACHIKLFLKGIVSHHGFSKVFHT